MPMLAEIAAANAAFKIIKTALSNGKEIYDCGDAVTQFFDNKSVIAKRVAKKGQSDLEAFMALEKIKAQENFLKEHMIYAGRADMHSDWLKFQSECKRNREKKARLALSKRQATMKLIVKFITVVGITVAFLPIVIYLIIFLKN